MGKYTLAERYIFDSRRIEFIDSCHIEYCIADICNRNCACCSHLAPLAKRPNFVSDDEFLKNMIVVKKAVPDIHTFWLTGGEPTLHPDFIGLLERARGVFENCFVGIYSNGRFLNKYENDPAFWAFVKDNGIVWAVTNYGTDRGYIERAFGKFGCINNLAFVHSGKYFANLVNYSRNQPVTAEKYRDCGWERSKINIRNGKIFNCPSAEFVDLFNGYFGLDLKLSADDYLVIDERLTKERVDSFRGQTPFCQYCDLSRRGTQISENTKSKKIISEWSSFG